MNRFWYFATRAICFVLGFGVQQSEAQAFDFNLGYYDGINTDAKNLSSGSSNSGWTTERKPAYLYRK